MKQGAAYLIGGSVALVVHLAVGGTLARVDPKRWQAATRTNVELEVVEAPPPPPPPEPPKAEPEPPPPAPKPRLAMRRIARPKPDETPRPPPPDEPPKEPPKEPTPPVFGVKIDSTVTGDANMAVPVGDSLKTNDRTPRQGPPGPAVAEGPPSFAPVADSFVKDLPKVIAHDPLEDESARGGLGNWPPEARRLGLEGTVVLRVGIDRQGKVRSVRVIKRAGYGFDEAAVKSMWIYRWSPAITNDGRPVDFLVTYHYTFRPSDR